MKTAVIPARGGSKRIHRKNIRLFHGKPIIAWSIEAAIKSNCFDRVIVSTDDEEIAKIAESFGAEVPFMRPKNISDDFTGTIPVIVHAILEEKKIGNNPEMVCCIYATAPFISIKSLQDGVKIASEKDTSFSISVTEYPFPIQRAIKIQQNDKLEMLQPEFFNTRSQDLTKTYHDAGQFYCGKTSSWIDCDSLFAEYCKPIFLPSYHVQDIDTEEDWIRAEALFQVLKDNNLL